MMASIDMHCREEVMVTCLCMCKKVLSTSSV